MSRYRVYPQGNLTDMVRRCTSMKELDSLRRGIAASHLTISTRALRRVAAAVAQRERELATNILAVPDPAGLHRTQSGLYIP